jgi:hypothetical protein
MVIGHRHIVDQQHGQDRPPSRVGQGGKAGVQALGGGVTHVGSIGVALAKVNRTVE